MSRRTTRPMAHLPKSASTLSYSLMSCGQAAPPPNAQQHSRAGQGSPHGTKKVMSCKVGRSLRLSP